MSEYSYAAVVGGVGLPVGARVVRDQPEALAREQRENP